VVISTELVTAINNSIFRVSQKFKVEEKLNLVSFIFFLKFKCNRIHLYGLSLV
jgi:hypothetical protein